MSTGSRPHQHYVAFSRVTRLQWLHLLNGFNGQIQVDKAGIQEMERLRREAQVALCYNQVNSNKCDFLTVFQNAQSLHLHMPLIQTDKTFTDADILCFSETRLHDIDLVVDYAIEGFLPVIRNDQHHKTPHMRPSHGLAIYVKNCHQVVSIHRIATEQFESLAVDVMNSHSGTHYSIRVVYKAPRCPFGDFKKHLLSLSKLQLSDKLIIVGDFNFNIQNDRNTTFLNVFN